MASRSISRHDRIIKVLFCLISFCLGPTVNRALGTLNNAEVTHGQAQPGDATQQQPEDGPTYGMMDTGLNNPQLHNIDEGDNRKELQYLYNTNLNDWNGFSTIGKKLSNDLIQDISVFEEKFQKCLIKTKSHHMKFDEKGKYNIKFKIKRYIKDQSFDLYKQLLGAWEHKEKEGIDKRLMTSKEDRVCVDECSAIPKFISVKLPYGCTQSPENSKLDVICTNITTVPKFSEDFRHIHTVRFCNTNIMSFNATDSCNLPPRTNTLVFDTSPLNFFDGSNIHCRNVERIIIEKTKVTRLWNLIFFSPKDTSIKFLSLRSNELSYPPEVNEKSSSPATLPSLETLILNDNHLFTLPSMLFFPIRKSPVKHLLLRNCSLHNFFGHPFNYTQNLQALDISDNERLSTKRLEDLLQPLDGRNLSVLHSTHNKYSEPPFNALKTISSSLKELFLNNSAFQSLNQSSFPSMPKLEILAIGLSKIDMIHEGTFDAMPLLKELYIEGNRLTTIPPAVLLPTLQVLNFDEQNIGNGGIFLLDSVDFKKVNGLEYLSLNSIPVREIKEVTFLGLNNLKTLKLNGAQISRIAKKSFSNLTQLTELYMNDNYIEHLPADTFRGLSELQHLEIQSNCLSFLSFNKYSPAISSLLKYGKPLLLAAWLKGIKRRLMIDSTVEADKYDSNTIPYASPFSGQVNLTYIDLSHNTIRYLFEQLFVDMKSLRYLNLNHNHIDEWDEHLFENGKSLTKVHLYGNKISSITEGMKKSLFNISYIDLRDNDFDCDCSLQYLNNSRFYGSDKYRCKDKTNDNGYPYIIDYLSDNICGYTKLETLSNLLTMIMVPSLVCLTLIVLAVTGYRKRWYVLYVMHKFRNRSRVYQEQVKFSKYMYDTFVCYASSDSQWIFEHLIPKLEDNERLRVCVHERDFTVGQEITDNIVDSIDSSRKVIVVLSPAFVKSSWCMFELKIANSTTVKTRESKLIFILLEHIQEDLMPKTLGALLKTRTYIPWFLDIDSQKLFWARIKKAVAKPSECEIRADYTRL